MKFPTNKEIKQYKVKKEDKEQFYRTCRNWAIENPTQAKEINKTMSLPPLISCPDGIPDDPNQLFKIEVLDTPIARFSYWVLDKYKGSKEADLIIGKLLWQEGGGFNE